MQCPYCNYKESKVVDSRHTDSKSIRRRRECESCKTRFTTYEKIETTPVMVVKKDNTREYFSGEKIKHGILKACEKRPVSIEQIEEIVFYIENEINKNFSSEVEAKEIGEMVMEKEGEDMEDVRQAAFMRACCYLTQQKPEKDRKSVV